MKCPFCGHADTQVVETRESDDGVFVRAGGLVGGETVSDIDFSTSGARAALSEE